MPGLCSNRVDVGTMLPVPIAAPVEVAAEGLLSKMAAWIARVFGRAPAVPAAAEGAGAFARELLPADLGLGQEAQFIGRISGGKGGVANVDVVWSGGAMGDSGLAPV